MIHAYSENYLLLAQNQLAVFFDYSVNYLNRSLESIYEKFLKSSISDRFMNGDPTIIAGRSGVELAHDVLRIPFEEKKEYLSVSKSEEYWLGYYLAYFQWFTNIDLNLLNKYISINEILELYNPYHEMDVTSFVDRMIEIFNERKQKTNLEIRRRELNMSRSDLANISGVSIRLIEHYEQRVADINKASSEYVIAIANALHAQPKDLLEIK